MQHVTPRPGGGLAHVDSVVARASGHTHSRRYPVRRAAVVGVESPTPRLHTARLSADSPAAQLVLAAFTIAVIFGLFLVAPLPIWAGQPFRPPQPEQASPTGDWAATLLMLVFVLA